MNEMALPYTDYLPWLKAAATQQWQSRWDQEVNNKLHQIRPTIKKMGILFSQEEKIRNLYHKAPNWTLQFLACPPNGEDTSAKMLRCTTHGQAYPRFLLPHTTDQTNDISRNTTSDTH